MLRLGFGDWNELGGLRNGIPESLNTSGCHPASELADLFACLKISFSDCHPHEGVVRVIFLKARFSGFCGFTHAPSDTPAPRAFNP